MRALYFCIAMTALLFALPAKSACYSQWVGQTLHTYCTPPLAGTTVIRGNQHINTLQPFNPVEAAQRGRINAIALSAREARLREVDSEADCTPFVAVDGTFSCK